MPITVEDAAYGVDELVADDGHQRRQRTEDDDAGGAWKPSIRLMAWQSTVPVAAKPRYISTTSTSGKAAPLTPNCTRLGDHLRQAQARALGRVQRHHDAAQNIADEQADDGRHRLGTKHHGQSAVDHSGDLHIGAEPQRELAGRRAMAFQLSGTMSMVLVSTRGPCSRG